MPMPSEYIKELAELADKRITPEEWRDTKEISHYLAEKPATVLALEQELECHVPLQAHVAWHVGYTPSKWLLKNELDEVRTRRDGLKIAWVDEKGDIQGGGEEEIAGRHKKQPIAKAGPKPDIDVYDRAARSGLMGVCFSGGGIRSATFNLGILQGLAQLDLLKCFDYLASVSGGGYIHQWLTAWISRQSKDQADKAKGLPEDKIKAAQLRGFQEVNKQLIPLPHTDSPSSHPEPIRWLRRYSNYLTPEKGLFTADTWVVLATWLRNTLLNQIILISSLLLLILLPHLFTFSWFVPTGHWSIVAAIAAILYFFLVAVAIVGRELSLLQSAPDPPGTGAAGAPGSKAVKGNLPASGSNSTKTLFLGQSGVQRLIVLPLLLAALMVTLLFPIGAVGIDYIWAWVLVPILYAALTLTVTFAGGTLTSYLKSHHFIAPKEEAKDFWPRAGWRPEYFRARIAQVLLFLAAVIVAFGGAAWHFLVSLMTVWLPGSLGINLWRLELVIAPPLLLIGPLLTALLLIGLIGRTFKDSRREW